MFKTKWRTEDTLGKLKRGEYCTFSQSLRNNRDCMCCFNTLWCSVFVNRYFVRLENKF